MPADSITACLHACTASALETIAGAVVVCTPTIGTLPDAGGIATATVGIALAAADRTALAQYATGPSTLFCDTSMLSPTSATGNIPCHIIAASPGPNATASTNPNPASAEAACLEAPHQTSATTGAVPPAVASANPGCTGAQLTADFGVVGPPTPVSAVLPAADCESHLQESIPFTAAPPSACWPRVMTSANSTSVAVLLAHSEADHQEAAVDASDAATSLPNHGTVLAELQAAATCLNVDSQEAAPRTTVLADAALHDSAAAPACQQVPIASASLDQSAAPGLKEDSSILPQPAPAAADLAREPSGTTVQVDLALADLGTESTALLQLELQKLAAASNGSTAANDSSSTNSVVNTLHVEACSTQLDNSSARSTTHALQTAAISKADAGEGDGQAAACSRDPNPPHTTAQDCHLPSQSSSTNVPCSQQESLAAQPVSVPPPPSAQAGDSAVPVAAASTAPLPVPPAGETPAAADDTVLTQTAAAVDHRLKQGPSAVSKLCPAALSHDAFKQPAAVSPAAADHQPVPADADSPAAPADSAYSRSRTTPAVADPVRSRTAPACPGVSQSFTPNTGAATDAVITAASGCVTHTPTDAALCWSDVEAAAMLHPLPPSSAASARTKTTSVALAAIHISDDALLPSPTATATQANIVPGVMTHAAEQGGLSHYVLAMHSDVRK